MAIGSAYLAIILKASPAYCEYLDRFAGKHAVS